MGHGAWEGVVLVRVPLHLHVSWWLGPRATGLTCVGAGDGLSCVPGPVVETFWSEVWRP